MTKSEKEKASWQIFCELTCKMYATRHRSRLWSPGWYRQNSAGHAKELFLLRVPDAAKRLWQHYTDRDSGEPEQKEVIELIPYRKLKARIEKDKAKKKQRQEALHQQYDNLEKAFTPRHYIKAIKKCRKGVSFKLSVQTYSAKPFQRMEQDCNSMLKGISPMIASNKKEIIRERGHERTITPIKMEDRVNQRVLCDYALTPIVTRRLIYDNGASLKGKGVSFTRKRFNRMLEKAKCLWGDDFYALTFDFEHFFDSIPHALCLSEMERSFQDQRLVSIVMQVIESYQMLDAKAENDTEKMDLLNHHLGTGICLGSHVSQMMALCAPNFLDHYLKDVCRVKLYIRYMDDGIIFHSSKAYLKDLLERMDNLCKQHGLHLNRKKTHIVPMRKGVMFLKVYYKVRDHKTLKRLWAKSIVRMRRKLKKFVGLVKSGKMTLDGVFTSIQSWLGHTRAAKSYYRRKRMLALYSQLFGAYRMEKWRCYAA